MMWNLDLNRRRGAGEGYRSDEGVFKKAPGKLNELNSEGCHRAY